MTRFGFKGAVATTAALALSTLALVAGTGCAAPQEQEAEEGDTLANAESVGTATAALSSIGWDRILPPGGMDWHLQNGTANCAQARQASFPVKASAVGCNTADGNQDWYRIQKGNGREEICKGPEKHVTSRQCIAQDASGTCLQWATDTYSNSCLQPVRFIQGKPTEYRVASRLLSYKPEIVGVDPATIAYVSTQGTFTVDGTSVKDSWRAVTKGADGVLVPADYVGSAAQQWTFVAVSNH